MRTFSFALWLLAIGCAAPPPEPGPALTPEQIEFATFWPRNYLLDLRDVDREGSISPAAIRTGALQLGEGWSEGDADGRWAVGDRSTVLVQIATRTDLDLYFEYRSPGVESILVDVNGVAVGELPVSASWNTHVVRLDDELRAGRNAIELRYTAGPGGFPLRSETGPLSVFFRTVGVIASDGSVSRDDGASGPFSRTDGGLAVGAPGTLLIPLRSDQRLTHGQIGVTSASRGWRRSRLTARFMGVTETEEEGSEPDAVQVAAGGLWGRGSVSAELPLDGRAGPGCFILDIDLASGASPLRVESLTIEESLPESVVDPISQLDAPDIVLIVLDAARADHFGAYGYGRDTTPNIDRLADGSLVFDQVIATAPYTLSSMATMLTGLSFTQHGVTARGHVLPEATTTLAEYLQEAGYRTACLSANPNNSVALGLDQGCEQFEEFWRGVRPPESLDPYRVSRSGLEHLADETGDDRPLFLMLHYVPPHEPYTPAPEFDLFGDETYEGGYDGSLTTILGVDRGDLDPTEADLAEIISLYDGNLRTGDDAVGLVLDALRARDRWDQTVVLVTSDHGEAFREHGRMGHNSTVYDEMLHVPFILRIPGTGSTDVDLASLGSLADVTPTLLGLAGIAPRSRLYGHDLLAPYERTRQRVISRSGGEQPFFSYRTDRWKAIRGREGFQRLFDMRSDPAESQDLSLEHYEVMTCLDALLRWELSGAVDPSSEGGRELSEEDIRTLRSLGYIR